MNGWHVIINHESSIAQGHFPYIVEVLSIDTFMTQFQNCSQLERSENTSPVCLVGVFPYQILSLLPCMKSEDFSSFLWIQIKSLSPTNRAFVQQF